MNFFEGMDIQVNGLSFINAGAASAASSYSSIILIVLMIALMYFFMIRPQQKQRKQHQDMMSQLHKGDEVVTIGRMHGTIDSINREDKTVTLDCEGIYLTFDMVAIARVVKRADQPAAADKSANDAPKEDAADSSASADNSEDSEQDNDNSEK